MFFLKIIANCDWRYVYFECPLEFAVKNLPVPTKRATISKVKTCSVMRDWLSQSFIT